MRIQALASALVVSLIVTGACATGGGGDDDDGSAADASTIDAAETATDAAATATDAAASADGPTTGGGQLGATCNPAMMNCATGFTCLNLTGGTAPWCSDECTAGTDCGGAFAGPGEANCYLQVDFGDGMPRSFCGIVCEDLAGGAVCPSCNGTCPNGLACTNDLMDQGSTVVARGCQ